MNLALLRSRRGSLRRSKAQLGVGKQQAAKLNRNALSACGDSARATAASQAHDRELDPQELSSLCSAAKAIATEVVLGLMRGGAPSPAPVKAHALIIDGRELREHMISVLTTPALGLHSSWRRTRAASARQ